MIAPIRIGALRLTDSASLAVAQEWGLFEQMGVEAVISVEPSWANLVDKLAYGLLDAAIMLPPLVLAANMGLRGRPAGMVAPMGISQAGNAVVLAGGAAPEAFAATARAGCDVAVTGRALVAWMRAQPSPPPIAVVHLMSSHNLLLRHWLAESGGDPDHDMRTVVLPPERVVEGLAAGDIAGFCAGAPWGDVAEAVSAGRILLGTGDLRPRHPEKCLAFSGQWAAGDRAELAGVLRALRQAGRLCDDPAQTASVARLMEGGDWRLPRGSAARALAGGGGRTQIVFADHDAGRIRPADGVWLGGEMRRWGLLPPDADIAAAVAATCRPDLAEAVFAEESGDWKHLDIPRGPHPGPLPEGEGEATGPSPSPSGRGPG